MSVASGLPVAWWAKLGLGVLFAFALLPVLGWVSRPLGRVLRFLLVPVRPLPRDASSKAGGLTAVARATIARGSVDNDTPAASRVVIEFAPGDR